MGDAASRRLQPLAEADLPRAEGFSARLAPPMARFVLRADASGADRASRAFGLAIPSRPLSSSADGARAALWLGPDEWLLLVPAEALAEAADALHGALAGAPHSLVDVSHRQAALLLTGRLAARVLSSGCPLDLGPGAFPPGTVARTLFHKAEIVLWRQADGFHLEVWRSFTPYIAGHLDAALQGAKGLPPEALV